MTPRDEAVLILERGIGRVDVGIVRALVSPHYKQHNPGVPDGPNGLIDMVKYLATLPETARPHPRIARVLVDGDFVIVHAEYRRGTVHGAGIDMFRMENGKLAEHWDTGVPSPDVTKNGHTTLDGETEIRDRERTAENKASRSTIRRDDLREARLRDVRFFFSRRPRPARSRRRRWDGRMEGGAR